VGIFGAVQLVKETGLAESKLEGAELAGEQRDDGGDGRGWD